jgi:hypothetical protein
MIRTLILIIGVGFVMSVACLATAVSIAGPDLIARGGWAWRWHEDGPGWDVHKASGPQATRDFPWSGGDQLAIAIPADVRYVQADGPAKLTITGPADVLDRIEVRDGRIGFRQGRVVTRESLQVVLTAPGVRRFDISGSGDLKVEDYRQDEISIDLSGSGSAEVRGRAGTVRLDISGSGEADLSELPVQGAEVDIAGSGEAKVRATDWARLNISGSGSVDLIGQPRRVETDISGSGEVNHRDAPDAPNAPAAPPPPAPPKPPRAV